MATLLLRLAGPMQSWGTSSRFTQRDTGKEPSKSGVIGLLAAALGIDRDNWSDLEPLTHLRMGVRHDRPGLLKTDYQTAGAGKGGGIIKADGSFSSDGVVSQRFYLADAVFLVGLEGDGPRLEKINSALQDPVWPLFLGRKSYVPSEPVFVENGVQEMPLRITLANWPWLGAKRSWEKPPKKLLLSMDSADGDGSLRMDQPLSSFADRRFGSRFIQSEWVNLPREESNVVA